MASLLCRSPRFAALLIVVATMGRGQVAFENPTVTLDTPTARAAYHVTDPALRALAIELLATPDESVTDVPTPNPHLGAAWWRDAGLGLFMHWGFHSVEQLQPSWASIRGYPYGTEDTRFHGMGYFRLADRFNPQLWAPAAWTPLAHAAGFRYAVLTAKHHDGFALWPTRWGNFSTRQYCDGRDLLRPYVDGLRAAGLKVGFYFSPQDWHYPGFPLGDVNFDHRQRNQRPPIGDPAANEVEAREFFIYTIAQLHELLTGYGPIDELWFDGLGWPGVTFPTKSVYRWIRSLQPQILINDRWGRVRTPDGSDTTTVKFGDFTTHEYTALSERPEGAWEYCRSWYGHWGYSGPYVGDLQVELERLGRIRTWNGNYLLNIGPDADGRLPAGLEAVWSELAAWMAANGEAIHGAHGGPEGLANVPTTEKGNVTYLHAFAAWRQPVEMTARGRVKSVRLLGQPGELKHEIREGRLSVTAPGDRYRIIRVEWAE